MPYMPRLPRKVEVDVSKYHACHVKRRWMSQSATPATQSAATATQSAATCPQVPRLPRKKPRRPRRHLRTKRATRASPMPYVPRLPRKVEVDVSKYHACHAQRRWMSQRATPATPTAAVKLCEDDKWCQLKTSCVWRTSYVWPLVPRLPRKVQLHVAKCCACHSKCSYMSPSATPVTQKATAPTATPENQARYQSQPSATSATPATQSAATCRQVPRLPCKKPRRPQRHLRTKRASGASPMPYVPHLPRKVEVDVSKYHACHVKRRWMSQSATPAKQSAATATQSARTKHAAGASPMPYVPRLPRKLEVDVSKHQACHVKRRWMSQSATPATQSAATCPQVPRLPRTCV